MLHQIYELENGKPAPIARLQANVRAAFEMSGARFAESPDDPDVQYALFVLDDGDEVAVTYSRSGGPLEVASIWQEERTPRQVVGLLLADAGVEEGAVLWVAEAWPAGG